MVVPTAVSTLEFKWSSCARVDGSRERVIIDNGRDYVRVGANESRQRQRWWQSFNEN